MAKLLKILISALILLTFLSIAPQQSQAGRLYFSFGYSPYWWGGSIGFYGPYSFGYAPFYGYGRFGYSPLFYYGMYNAYRPNVRMPVPNPTNKANWNKRLAALSQEKMQHYFATEPPVLDDSKQQQPLPKIKINPNKQNTPTININEPTGELTPKETEVTEDGSVVITTY